MENPKRSRAVTLLLVLLPLWLVASGGGALWYYFHKQKKEALVEQERFAQAVSVPLIADDLRKIVEIIGERNTATETTRGNLSRAASMIEGLLGPSNTGYAVSKTKGPADWPILEVSLAGKDPDAPAVWVIASYDSPRGSRGVETNATGLAATLAAAQALARDKPKVPVHFAFVPHSNDQDSKLLATAGILKNVINTPKEVLCVEAMGSGESLWFTPSKTSTFPPELTAGLGRIAGWDSSPPGGSLGLTGLLAESGLPACRVSTRTIEPNEAAAEKLPFAPTVAASTGRLVGLIRRCAEK